MKDFDNSFLTVLSSEEAVAFWLVDMQIDSTTHQYFTTLDIDLVIDGDRYISTDMSVSPVNYSVGMSVDKMRLEFENVSLTMSGTLLNNNVTGQPMIIYGGAMPLNYHDPANRGLVGYWSMDEGTGDIAYDESFYSNHGALYNSPSWVSGVSGTALEFDGVDQYINVPDSGELNFGTGDFTISMWLTPDIITNNRTIFNKVSGWAVGGVTNGIIIGIANSRLLFETRDGSNRNNFSSSVITQDETIHVVFVRKAGEYRKIFINGVEDVEDILANNVDVSNAVDLRIGYDTNTARLYNGDIDEIRVYKDKALSKSEINDLYSTPGGPSESTIPKLPSTSNLEGYWALDENTGTNAEDSSINGNDGTITGTSWVSGISGSSLSFNGGSDIVSFSEVTLSHGSWSISYWMVQDADFKMSIGQNGTITNRTYHRDSTLSTAYIRIHLNDGDSVDLDFGEIMQDTGWRHLVITADGDTMKLYLDGNLVDTQTELTNEFRVNCIGNPHDTTSYTWEGELDEVRLYTEALSANEIKALYLNPGGSRQPLTEVIFRGLTSDWSLDEKKAEITVVDEFVYWNKRTLRKPDALCPWVFKGTECGYSGSSALCNKSYTRCDALGNTDSFGGFRFFPAMEEKEVWWGKQS